MTSLNYSLLLLSFLPIFVFRAHSSTLPSCNVRSKANYSVTFFAEWNMINFPKQYPTYRPPAQWSLLFGCIHNPQFTVWDEGALASAGVKSFVEHGDPKLLTEEVESSEGKVQHWFIANPIISGEGKTSAIFTVDPSHPLVSLLVRIIPSPDWFVGASSLNLCNNDQWKETVLYDLFPWDAGTDSGFTFSSPNFATDPPEPIFQITAKHPSHPANSFFYPRLETLPRIGHLEFDLLSTEPIEGVQPPANETTHNSTIADLDSHGFFESENDTEPEFKEMTAGQTVSEKDDILPQLQDKQEEKSIQKKVITRQNGTPLDCEMSDWSSWGLCSRLCGKGTRQRTRFIILHPANDGEPCPDLMMEEECEESYCPITKKDHHFSNATESPRILNVTSEQNMVMGSRNISDIENQEPSGHMNTTLGLSLNVTALSAMSHEDTELGQSINDTNSSTVSHVNTEQEPSFNATDNGYAGSRASLHTVGSPSEVKETHQSETTPQEPEL